MNELSFEQAQAELERIVDRLESGRAELGEAIALWQRGEELYRQCRKQLDAAQGKVEELAKRVEETGEADGLTPFTDESSSA